MEYFSRPYYVSRLYSFLVVALGVALDQWTKFLASAYLQGQKSFVLIPGVLQLTYVENTGAAFGSFKDQRWLFMIVSVVAILFILFYILYERKLSFLSLTAFSMILSGGIGNMIDRLSLGYVVDFIDFCLIHFAVFNLADSFVTVGAVLVLLSLFLDIWGQRKANNREGRENDPAPGKEIRH